jgi:hypothetical protein
MGVAGLVVAQMHQSEFPESCCNRVVAGIGCQAAGGGMPLGGET